MHKNCDGKILKKDKKIDKREWNNIKVGRHVTGSEGVDWIYLSHDNHDNHGHDN